MGSRRSARPLPTAPIESASAPHQPARLATTSALYYPAQSVHPNVQRHSRLTRRHPDTAAATHPCSARPQPPGSGASPPGATRRMAPSGEGMGRVGEEIFGSHGALVGPRDIQMLHDERSRPVKVSMRHLRCAGRPRERRLFTKTRPFGRNSLLGGFVPPAVTALAREKPNGRQERAEQLGAAEH